MQQCVIENWPNNAHSKGSFRIRGRQFYLCVYENEEEDARDENEK